MPIYEFKCLACNDIFELLLMKRERSIELNCPKCHSEDLERVMSASSHTLRGSSGHHKGAISQTRACSSGSCTTYDIPGPTR